MEPYGQSFAELYDVFYSDKPYRSESLFIDALIRQRLGTGCWKLLELACGTGNHSFEFERLGYDVTATDRSEAMINIARHKATSSASAVKFMVVDMCEAGAADAAYDVVVCLFDSIGYLLENERILSCLENIRRRLRPGGVCILECWHAAAMLSNRSPVRVRHFHATGREIVRISETVCFHAEQNCSVNFRIVVMNANGTWQHFEETHRNRYFLKKEMDLFLEAASMRPLACLPGYELNGQLTESAWHLIHMAERI